MRGVQAWHLQRPLLRNPSGRRCEERNKTLFFTPLLRYSLENDDHLPRQARGKHR